ncbi:MAG: hypothetical protein J7L53_11795 [Deltaproteobacteria bacterium]|nr:hypothetical protein [Deltaproteobacteria bacterium]
MTTEPDTIYTPRFRGLVIFVLIIGFGILLGILFSREAMYETRVRIDLLKKEAHTITALLKDPAIRYIKSDKKDTMFEKMVSILGSSSLGVLEVHLLNAEDIEIFGTKKEHRDISQKKKYNFNMILKKLEGGRLGLQIRTPLYSDSTLLGFMEINYPEDLSHSSFFKSKKEVRRETIMLIIAVTITVLIIIYILLIRYDRHTAVAITKEMEQRNLALSEEVKRNERLAVLGRMTASIAHDLRSPITSIKTFAQLLETKYNDPEFRKDFIRTAINQSDRIDRFINNMLDYARPLTLHMDLWDISGVIDDAMMEVTGPERKDVAINKEVPNGMMVMCDRDHMLTLIENIILNACQAVDPGGQIMIKAGDLDRSFFIEITDNGRGISQKIREHIFEPFFTTKNHGTGLGLAICEKVVNAHHGRIEVDSSPEKGTSVKVIIPAQEDRDETIIDSRR